MTSFVINQFNFPFFLLLYQTFLNFFFLFLFLYESRTTQEINYDSPRGGVSVITEKGEVTTSYLLIQKAKISDSGLYTCMPTHANPNTVNVHVLNGMCNVLYIILIFHFAKQIQIL